MRKGKITAVIMSCLICIGLVFSGTYTTVQASQKLENVTNAAQAGITDDMSDFLGNYTMIGNDGVVKTVTTAQMDVMLYKGSEVVQKDLIKEVSKQQLSRETLNNLETSIYEMVDMVMEGSEMTEAELALLKSSIASIVEQNVLAITTECYDVSERNRTILQTSIEEKLSIIEEILTGYDKRLTQLQTDLDTLTTDVKEAEKREDMSQEEVDELQKKVNDITSQLTNLQMKYESYTISSVTASMIVDGSYEDNKELLEYATKEALANSEAATKEKLEKLNSLIGEWNNNVTLAQAVADAQVAIEQNNSDIEGKLKNLQTIFELEMISNKTLTDTDIKNMESTIKTLQATVDSMSSTDVETLNKQRIELEQKLAENANADAQTKTSLMTQINQLNEKIKDLAGLENVSTELETLVNNASDELNQVFDTKIQTLQTQMTSSISEIESALGDWTEDTTIAEYLVAAHTAITTNDANQTAQINAAKTALELQIANSKEDITDEQKEKLDAAVAALSAAIAGEASDREQALTSAQTALESMIDEKNTALSGLMEQKVSNLTTSLNTSVSSINSSIDILNTAVGAWDGSGTIASALKEAQENNSLLNSQLQDTNNELQDAISSLTDTQSSLTATQNSLTNTNSLLSKLQTIVATDGELNGSYTGTLIDRMAVSESLISSLSNNLSSAETDVDNLQSAVIQLQQLAGLNASNIEALYDRTDSQTQQIIELQNTLGDQVTFTVVDGVLYITTKE